MIFFAILGIILIIVGFYFKSKNNHDSTIFWLTYGTLVAGFSLLIGSFNLKSLDSLLFLIFIIFIFYCGFTIFKNRTNQSKKREWIRKLILTIIAIFTITLPSAATTNNKPENSKMNQHTTKHKKHQQKTTKKADNKTNKNQDNKKEKQQQPSKNDAQKKPEKSEPASAQPSNEDNKAENQATPSSASNQDQNNNSQQSDTSNDYANQPSSTSPSNQQSDDSDKVNSASGPVIGNSRTMTYHTSNQANYKISSSNTVYFSSEAEAQAAGYHKALR
ncbi:hypothetical protein M8332_05820 [Fructilactobacillus ixorae]|uniref:Uncharacterized protein n=1 Tax=Fructilactobacillus ixorae TaxID=1750535 RepID=A0ABY5C2V2_9LACO|nr:hypothetical protein [Fructilactobacillus ixorae]USS93112.1 hypothetical protein M8332_05820 [Fructilactobacillus ixorae]